MATKVKKLEIIKNEAWNDLSQKDQKKFNDMMKYNLSFLQGEPLYRQGVRHKHMHSEAIEEMRKFLVIKVLVKPKHVGMFGPVVVAAWHSFILHTQEYEKFCKKFYGRMIHHVPGGKPEDDTTVWLGVYHSWFGNLPPIWAQDQSGNEIGGMENKMNILLSADNDHLDSDNGAY